MGFPDVLTIQFNSFFGIGISLSINTSKYGKTLDIGILLPFIFIGIFCRKIPVNKWFQKHGIE